MQNLSQIADQLVKEYFRGGSSWWIPAFFAGAVFLSATWSIQKQIRAILTGK
jgi:hypothetical protein